MVNLGLMAMQLYFYFTGNIEKMSGTESMLCLLMSILFISFPMFLLSHWFTYAILVGLAFGFFLLIGVLSFCCQTFRTKGVAYMTILFWLAFFMQLAVLMNVTIFDGNLDGLMLIVTSVLFLGMCIIYGSQRRKKK